LSLLLVCGWLGMLPVVPVRSASVPERENVPKRLLRSVQEIRRLRPEEAAQRHPVQMQGVVTYCDPEWGAIFFQDETAGIYVNSGGLDLALELGSLVELEGVTAPGEYAPVVMEPTFRRLGDGRFPEPLLCAWEEASSGRQDSQWVQMEGVVQSASIRDGHLFLEVVERGRRFQAVLPGFWDEPFPGELIDAYVRLRGACGTIFNQQRQLVGVRLFVPDLDHIIIEKRAPSDPFALPIQRVNNLLRFSAAEVTDHRVRVQGVVTHYRPGQTLSIQDETGGLFVTTAHADPLTPGDRLDVVGFPAAGSYTPILTGAIFRRLEKGSKVIPVAVTAEQALSADFEKEVWDACLVRLEGRLVEIGRHSRGRTLVLQQGTHLFNARLDEMPRGPNGPWPRPGSKLSVTGVCSVQVDESRTPRSFQILLRGSEDVLVLESAPWWTSRHTILLICLTVLAMVSAAVWVAALRRQVRRQTEMIRQKLSQEQAMEVRYRDLFENNPHPMWVFDQETLAILAVNDAAVRHYGYTREEMVGMTIKEFGAEQLPVLPAPANNSQNNGGLVQARHKKKDGAVIDVEISSHELVFSGTDARLALMHDVTQRKRAELELARTHAQLLEASRLAGMAEVATGVLHNVGNVLNSVNVSATLVAEQIRKSKVSSLAKVAALLEENAGNLLALLSDHPKGRQLPRYLRTLADHLTQEQQRLRVELELVQSNIAHIKDIVTMQQNCARISGVSETIEASDLVEDALRINAAALDRHEIKVVREFTPVPPVQVDRHKILQILVNLIRNAKQACYDTPHAEKLLTLRIAPKGADRISIEVNDNGVGIPIESLPRIFEHGFTSKKNGHGFGLHSAALAARESGGTLAVQSNGTGQGATFTLEIPVQVQSN
jgi:PAS domain S-box-containing protein